MTSVDDAPAGWHCLLHQNRPGLIRVEDSGAAITLCEDCFNSIQRFTPADLIYHAVVSVNDYQIKSYWVECKSVPRWEFASLEAANVVADALNDYAKRCRLEGKLYDWGAYCNQERKP